MSSVLDVKKSKNTSPVQNGPVHFTFSGYCRDMSIQFLIRPLRMSKVTGDSHRWSFVPVSIFVCIVLAAVLGDFTTIKF